MRKRFAMAWGSIALAAAVGLSASLAAPGEVSANRANACAHLNVAFEIVEAHGGRLSLVNREGGGLCVALQLPDDPAAL